MFGCICVGVCVWAPLVLSCLERKLADCEILMTGPGTANQAAKQLTQAQTGMKSQLWGQQQQQLKGQNGCLTPLQVPSLLLHCCLSRWNFVRSIGTPICLFIV